MVELESNGPILFVKPFPKPEALEISSCLDAQEQYVLKKIYPDYSVTCVNKEGKPNKKQLKQFSVDVRKYDHIVIMGVQCSKLLSLKYFEWGSQTIHTNHYDKTFWFSPALGTMMTSSKKLKKFRAFVESIVDNL